MGRKQIAEPERAQPVKLSPWGVKLFRNKNKELTQADKTLGISQQNAMTAFDLTGQEVGTKGQM